MLCRQNGGTQMIYLFLLVIWNLKQVLKFNHTQAFLKDIYNSYRFDC